MAISIKMDSNGGKLPAELLDDSNETCSSNLIIELANDLKIFLKYAPTLRKESSKEIEVY